MPYSPAERALSLLAPSNQGCGNRTSRGTAEILEYNDLQEISLLKRVKFQVIYQIGLAVVADHYLTPT